MDDEGEEGRDREALIIAIEDEFARILGSEHGMHGVEVRIDRGTGDIACNRVLSDDVKRRLFAEAVKRAVLRRVRGIEGGLRP